MEIGDLRDWLALFLTPGLGPVGCNALIEHFGDPKRALQAGRRDLEVVPGLKKSGREALKNGPCYREADSEMARADQAGVRIITWGDLDYPELLRAIHSPPIVLYIKGSPELLQGPGLGMVGARAASDYGRKIAQTLASSLVRHGIIILSGMALGIDTAAHHGALAAGGGTVAVLGCGVDVVYPGQNRQLYDKLVTEGALVSEYPMGTAPESFRFPARNRIISGLSLGVLVVEAARRSGSLITAHMALEQGREVFAVPGRIDSAKSEGTHRLLKEGAKLVHVVEDVLDELPLDRWKEASSQEKDEDGLSIIEGLKPEEKTVFIFLDAYPKSIEEIILGTGLSAQKSSESLLFLELKGLVASLPGKCFQRI